MNRFILTFALGILAMNTEAQVNYSSDAAQQRYVQPDETTVEGILHRYRTYEGAVLNMSRPEWDVMRASNMYNKEEHIRILKKHKARWKAEHADEIADRKAQRMQMTGGCDCWIEPDETYTLITEEDQIFTAGAGENVDFSTGEIMIGWDYSFYGNTYDRFFISSKGAVTFDQYSIDWTPEEFPATTDEVAQIAGFWADADYRLSGDIYYKITEDAVFVNFVDVGYYSQGTELFNSYQIIFTDYGSDVLAGSNNTQLCYLDMQWAHGDVSGSGGCCGDTPATVGADDAPPGGASFLQFGRFNLLDDTYNGPIGEGGDNEDGVSWLDYQNFNFNAGSTGGNQPPTPTINLSCDTIVLCLGNEYEIDLGFLGPEEGQFISVSSTDAIGWDFSVSSGEDYGQVVGTFTALPENVGITEITIDAVDDGSPSATSTTQIVFEVLDVELPDLQVTGDSAICAGGTIEVSAMGEGFDEIVWSNGNTGYTNTYNYGGNFYVSGVLGQCSTVEYFSIDQSPYFLPDVDWSPLSVCPGETSIAIVDSLEQAGYASYEWEANWNGNGGDIVDYIGDAGAELTAGMYRLVVTDSEGCQGQRVFIVESTGSFIPDLEFEPFCDGIPSPVEFEGGYSSPLEGALFVYLNSSDSESGWGGSYLELTIGDETPIILTSSDAFTDYEFNITAGQNIQVSFVQDAQTDVDLISLSIYNCGFGNATIINDLTPGILFDEPSACFASPAGGSWDIVDSPSGSSAYFSVTDEYDTEFFPDTYGIYEICFEDDICQSDYCYELEITEEPSVALTVVDDLLCNGESETVFAEVDDIGGTATLNWSAPGTDGVASNVFSFSNTTTYNASIVVTNGCGSASASVPLYSQYTPNPSLDDESLCEGGTVYLDPTSPDTPDLEFEWYFNGNLIPGEVAEEYTAVETGEFCVEVSNQCGSGEACANISIVGDIPPPLDNMTIDCLGDGMAAVVPDLPEGYTVVWPDGSTNPTWEVIDGSIYDGEDICLDYTDPFGCETNTVCTYLYIGLPPTIEPEPFLVQDDGVDYWQWTNPYRQVKATGAPGNDNPHLTLCPEVEYDFELHAETWNGVEWIDGAGEYEWWVECPDTTIYFGNPVDVMTVVSSILDQNCWEYGIELVGSAINPCAVGGVRQEWDIVVDYCALTIPNVFTPDYGDAMNEDFYIEGLDVYDNVYMRIYNRWGQVVYSSNNYQNDNAWRPNNGETGTYWYTMRLPNGIDHNGHVTILRN